MYRRILAVLEPSSDAAVVEHAAGLARLAGAQLTLACTAGRPALFAYTGPVSAPIAACPSRQQLATEAERKLRRLAAAVPEKIPVGQVVVKDGRTALLREVERGGYDLVITADRTLRAELLGSTKNLLGRLPAGTSLLRVGC